MVVNLWGEKLGIGIKKRQVKLWGKLLCFLVKRPDNNLGNANTLKMTLGCVKRQEHEKTTIFSITTISGKRQKL